MPREPGRIRKRSLVLAGHATSVTLEEAFWRAVERLAAEEGCSLAALIERVDRERTAGAAARRPPPSLSSALRVHVLQVLAARCGLPLLSASPLSQRNPTA